MAQALGMVVATDTQSQGRDITMRHRLGSISSITTVVVATEVAVDNCQDKK
ncbi:MAG: hypothetical protein IT256_03425 [Chitinophagaceae bacterium]|nr:hypothetical protein [Chitinophagaceae bacterium]